MKLIYSILFSLIFILGCVLGCAVGVSTCNAQDLTAEDRAVIVETFRRSEQTNRLYSYLIPESARYFQGKADAYAAAADFVANYGIPPVSQNATLHASKTDAPTQTTAGRLWTRQKRVVHGRRCL